MMHAEYAREYSAGTSSDPPTDKIRNYETDDVSDTDSVAELNYSAWDDACAGDYQNTLGNIQNPPMYKIQNYETNHGSDADLGGRMRMEVSDCAYR